MKEKLKSLVLNDQYFYGVLVLLVGICSFFLGQNSVTNSMIGQSSEASVVNYTTSIVEVKENETQVATSTGEDKLGTIELVASKSGTKYHLPTCPGAGQIKPENRITFSSYSKARAAGYTPAANCPGLE